MKITKGERAKLDALWATYRAEADKLQAAEDLVVEGIQDAAAAFRERVEALVSDNLDAAAYEEAREALAYALDGIASDQEGEIDEKSDKWQEGDAGQAAVQWAADIRDFGSRLPVVDVGDACGRYDAMVEEGASIELIDLSEVPDDFEVNDTPGG